MSTSQIAAAKMNEARLYEITSDLMRKARKGGSHSYTETVQGVNIYIFADAGITLFAAFAGDDYIRTSNRAWFAGALAVALS